MRYLGQKSVSSTLHTVLNVLWYFFWVVGFLLVGGQLFGGFFAKSVLPGLLPTRLFIETPGLNIGFDTATTSVLSRGFYLFSALSLTLLFAIYLYILFNLRKIFGTLVADNPFNCENVVRIRRIGGAVIIGAILKSLVGMAFGFFIMRHVSVAGVDFSARLSLDFPTVFLGLVILVLAEIFRQGTTMQEEQELTV